MKYGIIWSPEAIQDWKGLRATDRALIRDAIETHLRYEPKKVSKSRIRRLRKMVQPQFRLRVAEFRIFYDVVESEVHILAVVSKSQSASWLNEKGEVEK